MQYSQNVTLILAQMPLLYEFNCILAKVWNRKLLSAKQYWDPAHPYTPLQFKCGKLWKRPMERKNWTEYQDQILKYLKEERKIKRWTDIAKIMNVEYKIGGRNGKQCRQRYHSHLERVFPKKPWTRKEELELLELHSEIGNKWSRIAQKMSDRSDNNIKNHFYSKLRRAARKVNKFIGRIFYKEKKQIKFNDVYLIMEIFQAKFRGNCEWEDNQSDTAQDLKNRLFVLALDQDETAEQQTQENITLAKDIVAFLDEIKRIHKRCRGKPRSNQDNLYSPDLKKSFSEKRNDAENTLSHEIKPYQLIPTTPYMKPAQSPRTEPSTPKINLHERLNEIDQISSLQLDNIEQEEKAENMEIFLDSIFEMSSLQNINSLKLFQWGESDNIFKSNELENIISLDFGSKERDQGFHLRNMLDE